MMIHIVQNLAYNIPTHRSSQGQGNGLRIFMAIIVLTLVLSLPSMLTVQMLKFYLNLHKTS